MIMHKRQWRPKFIFQTIYNNYTLGSMVCTLHRKATNRFRVACSFAYTLFFKLFILHNHRTLFAPFLDDGLDSGHIITLVRYVLNLFFNQIIFPPFHSTNVFTTILSKSERKKYFIMFFHLVIQSDSKGYKIDLLKRWIYL